MELYHSCGLKWSVYRVTYSAADTFIDSAVKCACCCKSEVIIIGSSSGWAVLSVDTLHHTQTHTRPVAQQPTLWIPAGTSIDCADAQLIVLLVNFSVRWQREKQIPRASHTLSAWLQTVPHGPRPADGAVWWAWLSKQHKQPSALIPARVSMTGVFIRLCPYSWMNGSLHIMPL